MPPAPEHDERDDQRDRDAVDRPAGSRTGRRGRRRRSASRCGGRAIGAEEGGVDPVGRPDRRPPSRRATITQDSSTTAATSQPCRSSRCCAAAAAARPTAAAGGALRPRPSAGPATPLSERVDVRVAVVGRSWSLQALPFSQRSRPSTRIEPPSATCAFRSRSVVGRQARRHRVDRVDEARTEPVHDLGRRRRDVLRRLERRSSTSSTRSSSRDRRIGGEQQRDVDSPVAERLKGHGPPASSDDDLAERHAVDVRRPAGRAAASRHSGGPPNDERGATSARSLSAREP